MTRQQVLDLYFMDARHKLIELAAFLDRVDRAAGPEDFRASAFRKALTELRGRKEGRAARVLMSFSDPTLEPIPAASIKGATGAWPGPDAKPTALPGKAGFALRASRSGVKKSGSFGETALPSAKAAKTKAKARKK